MSVGEMNTSTNSLGCESTSQRSNLIDKWEDIIKEMTFDDIVLLEYCGKNEKTFRKMFPRAQNSFINAARCSLCETASLTNFAALRHHIKGKKHITKVTAVVECYKHPKIHLSDSDNQNSVEHEELKKAEECNENKIEQENKKKSVEENSGFQSVELSVNPLMMQEMSNNNSLNTVLAQHTSVTSKQKSLTNMFRMKMLSLKIEDLIKIEYRHTNGSWKKMLQQNITNQIKCLLCNVVIIQSIGDIKQHIAGKKHQHFLDLVALLYHPTLANTKTEERDVSKSSSKENRLNDQHFRQEITNLSLGDLEQVEYTQDNKVWKKLISMINGTFKCLLCSTSNIIGFSAFLQHMKGRKHSENVNSVKRFYHPLKTFAKDDDSALKQLGKNPNPFSTISQSEITNAASKNSTSKPSTSSIQRSPATAKQREGRIVCTIDIEDSPEREIKTEPNDQIENKPTENIESDLRKSDDHQSESGVNDSNTSNKKSMNEQEKNKTSMNEQEKNKTSINEQEKNKTSINEQEKNKTSINEQEKNKTSINEQGKNKTSINEQEKNKTSINEQEKNKTSMNEPIKVITPSNQLAKNISKSRQQNQKKSNEWNPILRRQTHAHAQPSTSFTTKIFSSKIERDVEGLIGVEYVVKILKNVNDNSPQYECCLCEVEVDGVGMQWHLKGLDHRMKFLERHFPTAIRICSQYKNHPNYSAILPQAAEKLSVAIEKYHGRDLPYECLQDEFRSNRHGIMSKVFSFKHASELNGPSFTDIMDKRTIDEFIAKKTLSENTLSDPKRRTTFDSHGNYPNKKQRMDNSPKLGVEEHRKLVEQFLENTNRGYHRAQSPLRRRRSRSNSPFNYRDRQKGLRSPKPMRKRSRSRSRNRGNHEYSKRLHNSPIHDGNIWQIYCRQFDLAVEALENQYEKYRNDPESHPHYDDEWKQFWNRRTDELLAEGRNPTAHNFQPEWVKFFTHRLDELYEEDIENIRLNLRKKLGLGLQNDELSDNRYHVGIKRAHRGNESSVLRPTTYNMNEPFNNARVNQYGINMESPQIQKTQYLQQTQQMQRTYQMPEIPQIPQMPLIPQIPQIPQIPHTLQRPDRLQRPHKSPYEMQQQQHQIHSSQNSEQYQPPQKLNDPKLNETRMVESPHAFASNNRHQRHQLGPPKPCSQMEKRNTNQDDLEIDTEAVNPVSVLRLLTALEDQLGSLGPKVINLLSKALTLEKVKPNSSEESLLTNENCVLLETVREKLRGQILAGLAELPKVRAVKKAIKDITTLLDSVNEKIKNEEPQIPVSPPKPPIISQTANTSLTKPASANIERRELATKLASALSTQGRTSITTEQLEQLVTVYSVINKKTQERNATISQERDDREKTQKSLSDTLADLMKSSDNAAKQYDSPPNKNINIRPAQFSNPTNPYLKTNYKSQFQTLSNFDTSLKIDNPSVPPHSSRARQNIEISTDMLNEIMSSVNQNKKRNFEENNSYDFEEGQRFSSNATASYERQSQIPSLLSNTGFSRSQYGQQQQQHRQQQHQQQQHQQQQQNQQQQHHQRQQQQSDNRYNFNNRSITSNDGPMISYPSNNMRPNQGNRPRNHQTPMGWGGRYGNGIWK